MAARSSTGGTVLASGIRTREKKERKLYSDDWALGDEEIEGHHTFNLEEKITSSKFDLNFVKDMTDSEFDLAYMQKNGFNWPLLFRSTKNLGIVMPKSDFTINDVRLCVGSRRMLDVMDVNTQKNVEMTMKDWQRYYESQDKDKLLNVISLEFSHTKLETLVEAPTVVRQIDWVEKVWPRHLKEAQTESTNVLEDMMYPKVQKYCLMSVSGCYTDFHIDFGGTSVWYHILKGRKIFWLIPPSERNLQLYEQWVLSGKQGDVFFGDTVEKCARVELCAGNTFFIPTGWIHAVYTPDDSLVFGGNFLHSFGIEKQLRAAQVEDTTHVPQKFRYPFFTEMLWYLLERYVHVLLSRTHLTLPPEEQEKFEKAQNTKNNNDKPKEHVHLTQYELHGMKAIVMYLHSLPTSKKFVPELIKDPIALIRDVRTVVEHHRYDSPELAVTNRPVMEWWDRDPVKYTVKRSICDSTIYVKKRRQSGDEPKSSVVRLPPNVAKVRHRRIRCKECEPCTREDCQQCVFCKDMVKYGGGGTMKQTCKLKKCAQPMLPATAACYICHMDGWMRPITGINSKPSSSMGPSSLMECIICFKITHTSCLETKFKGIDCTINEDLPGSWECAECVQLGYNKEYKHNRTPSSRISSAGSDTNVKSPLGLSENEETKVKSRTESQLLSVKLEERDADDDEEEMKLAPTMNGTAMVDVGQEKPNISPGDPPTVKMPSWEQLQARVPYPLVRPSWVIRPAPPPPVPDPNDDEDEDDDDDSGTEDEGERRVKGKVPIPVTMRKEVMLTVFSKLPPNVLLVSMRVCRQWAEWAIDPSLWKSLSLAHSSIDEFKLHGVVRRQPSTLILDWSQIDYDEFSWLLCRLPQLKSLHCEGLSWETIRPLVSPYCPPLVELNISFCEGVADDTLSLLLRPPPFNRPGFRDTVSRLRQLVRLRLAGTQVGDASVSLIVRSLPFLTHVDLSGCLRITDHAIEFLAHSTSLVSHSLTNIDLRGCHQLTPMVLPLLVQLPLLSYLALNPCDLIPLKAIKVWGTTYGYNFDDNTIMTRAPPAKNSLTIDGISDSEGEIQSSIKESPRKVEIEEKSVDSGIGSKDVKQGEKGVKGENISGEVRGPKTKDLTVKNEKIKESLKLIKPDTKDKRDGDSTEKIKELKSTIKLAAKPDGVQLKCVLTPLEKTCKAVESKHDVQASKREQASSAAGKDPKSAKEAKAEKSKDNGNREKYAESKPGSFRRSERSNKGRKYKLNLVKRKRGKDRAKPSEGKCSKPDDDSSSPAKKLEGKAFKSANAKKTRKDLSDDLKRRARKNIVTRSKKPRDGEDVDPKQEYEVVPRASLKPAKGPKDGSGKGSIPSEQDDGLKVRIALKGGPQYISKLRKKSREDGSSSPSSSPESKSTLGNLKSQTKKTDDSITGQKKGKEQKETSLRQADESQGTSFIPKRKERTVSSSSSSPSPSPSPSPCIPLPKKLKVELKPISKIGRRKSDVPKAPCTPSGNSGSKLEGPSSSGGQSTSSNEKSSSRERPERHHRSPRRLSMCQ